MANNTTHHFHPDSEPATIIRELTASENPIAARALADLAEELFSTQMTAELVRQTAPSMFSATDADLAEYILDAPVAQRADIHPVFVRLHAAVAAYSHPRTV